MKNQAEKETAAPSRLRNLASRIVAVFTGIAIIVLVELALRIFFPDPGIHLNDAQVSFTGMRPLFTLNDAGTDYRIAPERLNAFRPQSFPARKRSDAFRIFCLGGSTVQGRPYSVETSFTTWLELNLRAARPDTRYEVINCGGISYASYRLLPVLQEVLAYRPDLIIICTGHNEFLEDRTFRHVKQIPSVLLRLHESMLKLRCYSLPWHYAATTFSPFSAGSAPAGIVMPPDVHTRLDLEAGLASYQRDPVWRQGTIRQFRFHLEAMIQTARRAGVPVILINPAANLGGCPPFKSQYDPDLTETQIQQVRDLQTRARKLDWNDAYGKINLLEQAAAIDNRHAGILYLLGQAYARLGRSAEARKWFLQAREQDICPLRILEPMRAIIGTLAGRYQVPLVDVQALIDEHSDHNIPDDQWWFIDHAHPTIAGHQLIADALFQTMEQMGLIRKPDDWLAARSQLRQEHLSSLNRAYYARGQARLRRLQQWSRGRIPSE